MATVAPMDTASALRDISPLSSMAIMFGIGESGLLQAIFEHPQFKHKDLHVCAFPGDVIPDRSLWPATAHVDLVSTWEQMQHWIQCYFSDHSDIVRLGGSDMLCTHALSEEAERYRADLMPRALSMLADRPWALGNDINDSFMGLWHAAQNAKIILPMPSIGELAATLGMVPAISIGAGPSLGTHLEELRLLQDKCLLVCCDAAYPGLVKEGIIPHIVTPLERLQQQAPLLQCAEGTRTVFGGIPACHPDALKPFGSRAIYLHAMDKLYDWLSPHESLRCLTGSSTGVLSFYVAASLTRGPIYLVGHDLSSGATGSHWDGAGLAGKAFAAEAAQTGGFGVNGYEKRLIPGNDGSMVESIMWWDNFRSEIAGQAKLIDGRVFNVNAHDKKYAVIEHTYPRPLPLPGDLPDYPGFTPLACREERYNDWKRRASELPADTAGFITAMQHVRTDLQALRRRPPCEWQLEPLMARLTPHEGVSQGNKACFDYFLRSAHSNEQMAMSRRARRFTDKTQAHWQTMNSLDALADAMTKAVEHIAPLLNSLA